MIMLLNVCRLLMVMWIVYALALMFAPHMLHHAPEPVGAPVQAVVAFAVGYTLDRIIAMMRRRKAMRMAAACARGDPGTI